MIMTTQAWEPPTFVELEMNAEIGAYQADGPNPPDWWPPRLDDAQAPKEY